VRSISDSEDGHVTADWFAAPWRRRALRRVVMALPPRTAAVLGRPGRRAREVVGEASSWRAARGRMDSRGWRRRTRSSYVVLYYHRLAGELKPGQERLDLSPELFSRQMRLLRRLHYRFLTPDQLLAFHDGSLDALPRRAVVVTADDGFLDCVEPFLREARLHPQLFVPTAEVGGRAGWAGGEPLAGWPDLQRLAEAGVVVGSHAHRHVPLPELDDTALAEDLASSRRELVARLSAAPPVLAYPHGQRDRRVVSAAARAGFRIAFTTDPGRNGADTDPLQLRRIGVKAWDSPLSLLWKAATGQLLPARWEARRISRALPAYRPPPPTPPTSGG
jgi:peptidoglycan/xylan/chitin deacetylase (PgdA/CDA1 family)